MIDLGHIGRDYAESGGVVPGSDWAGRVAVVVIVIVIVTARKRAGVGRGEVEGRSYAVGEGGSRWIAVGDGEEAGGHGGPDRS